MLMPGALPPGFAAMQCAMRSIKSLPEVRFGSQFLLDDCFDCDVHRFFSRVRLRPKNQPDHSILVFSQCSYVQCAPNESYCW